MASRKRYSSTRRPLDHISSLTDDVLDHVLSFLPPRSSVALTQCYSGRKRTRGEMVAFTQSTRSFIPFSVKRERDNESDQDVNDIRWMYLFPHRLFT